MGEGNSKIIRSNLSIVFDCFIGGNWCLGVCGKGKAGGAGGGNSALLNRECWKRNVGWWGISLLFMTVIFGMFL